MLSPKSLDGFSAWAEGGLGALRAAGIWGGPPLQVVGLGSAGAIEGVGLARGRGPGGCICLWRCPHITGAGGGILGVFCTVGASWGGSTWVCTLEGGSALGAHLGGGFCPGFVLGGGHLNCTCTLGGPALGVQLGRGSSGGVVPCMGHGGVSALGGHLGRGSALGVQFEGGVHPEGGDEWGSAQGVHLGGLGLGEILYIWAVCSVHVCAHVCTHTAVVQGVRAPLAYAAAFLGRGGSVRSPHVCASARTKLRDWFGGCTSIFFFNLGVQLGVF